MRALPDPARLSIVGREAGSATRRSRSDACEQGDDCQVCLIQMTSITEKGPT